MSRLPNIQQSDLKDHANRARVERIWKRVRDDLPVQEAAPITARSSGAALRSVLLFAAAGALFAAGLVAGRAGSPESTSTNVSQEDTAPMTDVFAAGSKQRSFALPGGGRLTLEPDSVVEVVALSESRVRLSLMRGSASVDAVDMGVEVAAGEAIVAAPAGASVSLSRRESDLDVLVAQGSADVTSPAGHHVVPNGHVLSRVPTITKVSANEESPVFPPPIPVAIADEEPQPVPTTTPPAHVASVPPRNGEEPVATSPSPPAVEGSPVVMVSWKSYAWDNPAEALRMIDKNGGLEAAIKGSQSAEELNLLWQIALSNNKHADLQILALRRVADEFGSDPSSMIAALNLAEVYMKAGQRQLADKYREQAAQSKRMATFALCSEINAAIDQDDVDAERAARTAKKYLELSPDGPCAEEAKNLLEELGPKLKAIKEKEKEGAAAAPVPSASSSASSAPAAAPSSPPSSATPPAPPSAKAPPAPPSSAAPAKSAPSK